MKEYIKKCCKCGKEVIKYTSHATKVKCEECKDKFLFIDDMIEDIDYVICPICNKKLRRITKSHIESHNISQQEFIKIYPNIILTCKKTNIKRGKSCSITCKSRTKKEKDRLHKIYSKSNKKTKNWMNGVNTWKNNPERHKQNYINTMIKKYGVINIMKLYVGDKHWNYKKEKVRGINLYDDEWKVNRKEALKRDNYECKICGNKNKLNVHHIIPLQASRDNSLKNLVTLCRSCHSKQDNLIRRCIKFWSTPTEENTRNGGKLPLETTRSAPRPYGWDDDIVRTAYKIYLKIILKLQR
jgi:hypothetical protein